MQKNYFIKFVLVHVLEQNAQNDGTPSRSVIKNILYNLKKNGSVAHVFLKHKNSGQKQEMFKIQLKT